MTEAPRARGVSSPAGNLIPAAEAAERAGVGLHTILRWMRQGHLTKYRRGPAGFTLPGQPRTYVDVDELQPLIDERAAPRAVPS